MTRSLTYKFNLKTWSNWKAILEKLVSLIYLVPKIKSENKKSQKWIYFVISLNCSLVITSNLVFNPLYICSIALSDSIIAFLTEMRLSSNLKCESKIFMLQQRKEKKERKFVWLLIIGYHILGENHKRFSADY